jgi:hypothetical protein
MAAGANHDHFTGLGKYAGERRDIGKLGTDHLFQINQPALPTRPHCHCLESVMRCAA